MPFQTFGNLPLSPAALTPQVPAPIASNTSGDLSPENRAKLNAVVHAMTVDKRKPAEIQTAVDQFKAKYAGASEAPQPEPPQKDGNFFQRVAGDVKKRFNNLGEAADATFNSKEQSVFELGLQGLGQLAGGIGDVIGEGITSGVKGIANTQRAVGLGFIPEFEQKVFDKATGAAASALTSPNNPVGQTVLQAKGYLEDNPRVARNLGAVGNIASLVPIGRGEKLAQEGLETALPKMAAKTAVGLEEKTAISSLNKTLEAISPALTKGEATEAIQAGKATPGGLFSKAKILPSPQDLEIAKTVQGIVKGKSAIADVNAVKDEIARVSQGLREGLKDFKGISSPNQLKAALSKVETSPLLVGDYEKTYQKVLDKALEIANKHPGTIAGTDAARMEFDQYVKKYVPNVFTDAKATALNTSIKDLRVAWNDYIASRLPEGNIYKSELTKMSNMYRAVDQMSTKAVGELGANKFTKFTNVLTKHPLLAGEAAFGVGVAGHVLAPLLFNPVTLAALAAGGTIYYAGKAITSDVAKQALISILKATSNPAHKEAIQAIIRTLEQQAVKGTIQVNQ